MFLYYINTAENIVLNILLVLQYSNLWILDIMLN